ncbi:CHAT domain-containing protein [Gimesia fumaroli]|uniref:CHAT domain protein n=1 Tax=Gimesia fumaroli TaxID=2527976 RepID=A0A518I5M2_9PLAN|nr:CHAT domain-containing protein [Gimesia fumaroli]QDV48414.1 CHAT domain protein [Gimesia fumaroli]
MSVSEAVKRLLDTEEGCAIIPAFWKQAVKEALAEKPESWVEHHYTHRLLPLVKYTAPLLEDDTQHPFFAHLCEELSDVGDCKRARKQLGRIVQTQQDWYERAAGVCGQNPALSLYCAVNAWAHPGDGDDTKKGSHLCPTVSALISQSLTQLRSLDIGLSFLSEWLGIKYEQKNEADFLASVTRSLAEKTVEWRVWACVGGSLLAMCEHAGKDGEFLKSELYSCWWEETWGHCQASSETAQDLVILTTHPLVGSVFLPRFAKDIAHSRIVNESKKAGTPSDFWLPRDQLIAENLEQLYFDCPTFAELCDKCISATRVTEVANTLGIVVEDENAINEGVFLDWARTLDSNPTGRLYCVGLYWALSMVIIDPHTGHAATAEVAWRKNSDVAYLDAVAFAMASMALTELGYPKKALNLLNKELGLPVDDISAECAITTVGEHYGTEILPPLIAILLNDPVAVYELLASWGSALQKTSDNGGSIAARYLLDAWHFRVVIRHHSDDSDVINIYENDDNDIDNSDDIDNISKVMSNAVTELAKREGWDMAGGPIPAVLVNRTKNIGAIYHNGSHWVAQISSLVPNHGDTAVPILMAWEKIAVDFYDNEDSLVSDISRSSLLARCNGNGVSIPIPPDDNGFIRDETSFSLGMLMNSLQEYSAHSIQVASVILYEQLLFGICVEDYESQTALREKIARSEFWSICDKVAVQQIRKFMVAVDNSDSRGAKYASALGEAVLQVDPVSISTQDLEKVSLPDFFTSGAFADRVRFVCQLAELWIETGVKPKIAPYCLLEKYWQSEATLAGMGADSFHRMLDSDVASTIISSEMQSNSFPRSEFVISGNVHWGVEKLRIVLCRSIAYAGDSSRAIRAMADLLCQVLQDKKGGHCTDRVSQESGLSEDLIRHAVFSLADMCLRDNCPDQAVEALQSWAGISFRESVYEIQEILESSVEKALSHKEMLLIARTLEAVGDNKCATNLLEAAMGDRAHCIAHRPLLVKSGSREWLEALHLRLRLMSPMDSRYLVLAESVVKFVREHRHDVLRTVTQRIEFYESVRGLMNEIKNKGWQRFDSLAERGMHEEKQAFEKTLLEWIEQFENRLLLERLIDRRGLIPTAIPNWKPNAWGMRSPWDEKTLKEGDLNEYSVCLGSVCVDDTRKDVTLSNGNTIAEQRPKLLQSIMDSPTTLEELIPSNTVWIRTLTDSDGNIRWWAWRKTSEGVLEKLVSTICDSSVYNSDITQDVDTNPSMHLMYVGYLNDLFTELEWNRHHGLDLEHVDLNLEKTLHDITKLVLATLEEGECGHASDIPSAKIDLLKTSLFSLKHISPIVCRFGVNLLEGLEHRLSLQSIKASVGLWQYVVASLLATNGLATENSRRKKFDELLNDIIFMLSEHFDLSELWKQTERQFSWSETDVVFQVQGSMFTLPLCAIDFGGKPLFEQVASTSTILNLALRHVTEQEQQQQQIDVPRILSVQWEEEHKRRNCVGLPMLHKKLHQLAQESNCEIWTLSDDPLATPENVSHAISSGRFGYVYIGAHGLFEESGVKLAGDAHEGIWRASDCDFSQVDVLTLMSCSVGRLSQNPGEDAQGLCATIAGNGGRTIVAARWNVADIESAHLISEFGRELSKIENKHHPFMRARALNQARKTALSQGVSMHVAAAFELYGVG